MFLSLLLLFDYLLTEMKHFREVLKVKLLHEMRIGLFEFLEGVPLK
jgi:hypothetical protein